jgi:hypothetical protein
MTAPFLLGLAACYVLDANVGPGGPAVGVGGHQVVVPSATSPLLRCPPMSDHTDRLKKISERISAAKEFL